MKTTGGIPVQIDPKDKKSLNELMKITRILLIKVSKGKKGLFSWSFIEV